MKKFFKLLIVVIAFAFTSFLSAQTYTGTAFSPKTGEPFTEFNSWDAPTVVITSQRVEMTIDGETKYWVFKRKGRTSEGYEYLAYEGKPGKYIWVATDHSFLMFAVEPYGALRLRRKY